MATLGPTLEKENDIRQAIEAGVRWVRLPCGYRQLRTYQQILLRQRSGILRLGTQRKHHRLPAGGPKFSAGDRNRLRYRLALLLLLLRWDLGMGGLQPGGARQLYGRGARAH